MAATARRHPSMMPCRCTKIVSSHLDPCRCALLTWRFPAIPLPNYIDPGAGLAQLGDWPHDSDYIFDSLFNFDVPDIDLSSGDASVQLSPELLPRPVPMVRTYRSDSAM
jgi:hypothetical protein